MLKAEYDAMMEAKGTPKVWVVERLIGNEIFTSLYATEEEAAKAYNEVPEQMRIDMHRTWDFWNWTKRHSA